MDREQLLLEIATATVALRLKDCVQLCRRALDAGVEPLAVLDRALVPGLDEVGQRYSAGEYYLAELVMSAEIAKQAMRLIEPWLAGMQSRKLGKVVAGTVKGDLHDIGKNIVVTLLRANGFEVVDLGMDVPARRFVEATADEKADIVAMSALLTTTMPQMEDVVAGLAKSGIRDSVKVIVGGAPVTPGFAWRIGADASSTNAVTGVETCKEWMREHSSSRR